MKFRNFLNDELKNKGFTKQYQQASQALELGIEIALHRKELGLTQQALANKTSIKRSMIARIEKGQLPTLSTLQKIAQALNQAT